MRRFLPVALLLLLAACGGSPQPSVPVGSGATVPSASGSAARTAAAPCTLAAEGVTQEANGGLVRTHLELQNGGGHPCTIVSLPTVTLTDSHGKAITARQALSPWKSQTLQPGSSLPIYVGWNNWCAQKPGEVSITIRLAGGSALTFVAGNSTPDCLHRDEPSRTFVATE